MRAGPGRDERTGALLVRLSRVRPEPRLEPAELDGVDAERLLFLASRLASFNLVARRLLAQAPGLDPLQRARVERNLNYSDLRERLGLADVRALAAALGARGEPLLLLKGGAYTRFIYPERGLRNFGDLDVLLRPGAVPAALAALEGLGYENAHEIAGSIDLVRRMDPSWVVLKLELHTDLVHHYEYPWYRAELCLSEERLLARGEERDLDGTTVLVLRAEDELLYSVLHFFFHHDLTGLKYHSDLNALLTDPARPLDVPAAIEVARASRAHHAVGLALLVNEALYGPGAVPARLLGALAPRGARRLALEALLPPFPRLPLVESRAAGHPAKVLVAPGLAAPLALARRWIFPGKRYLMSFYGLDESSWRASCHVGYAAAILRKGLGRLAPRTR